MDVDIIISYVKDERAIKYPRIPKYRKYAQICCREKAKHFNETRLLRVHV